LIIMGSARLQRSICKKSIELRKFTIKESKGFDGKRIYVNEKCRLFKYKGKNKNFCNISECCVM